MANCILCSRKLHFFNTPLFGSSKLKDGGIVCTWCCNKKIDNRTFWRLRSYTISDLQNLLWQKAIADERKKANKLLQEKLKTDKLDEANKLLQEKLKIDKLDEANKLSQEKPKTDKLNEANKLFQMKDVFICHASEDKKTFIEPLIAALLSEDISYWYDNAEINWGDSIVKKVNQGLRNSRFVLVAISMNSIKKHWPNAELEASINMEFSTGETKVLPLLIGNDDERKIIIEHYPILRSKLFVSYSIGPKEISRLLKERIMIN